MTTPLQTHALTEVYASAIAGLWDYYSKIDDPSFALKNDIDAWEVCLRHPTFYQGVQQRLNDVAGPDWRVFPGRSSKDPKDVLLAKIVEDALRSIRDFSGARKRQAQAIFKGSSCELITGNRKQCKLAGFPGNWWVPTRLENVDHRRFKIIPKKIQLPDGRVRTRGELYISTIPASAGSALAYGAGLYGYAPVNHNPGSVRPEWFLRTVYDDEESRLGFGRGIMDVCYFWVWTSGVVDREGLQGLERWAQGIVVGKIDPTAHGDNDQLSTTMATTMQEQLLKHRGRGVFVIDKRDEVQVITGGAEGQGLVKGWQDRIDAKLIGVTTGAVLASGVGSDVGSFARDKVGENVQNGVIKFDQNKMDEDVSEDLIGLFVEQNRPMLVQMGLSEAARPEFHTIQKKTYNPNDAAQQFATLKGAGLALREDEVYERVGYTPPAPGDKVIQGDAPQPQLPMFGGMGGLGGPAPAQNPAPMQRPVPPRPAQ